MKKIESLKIRWLIWATSITLILAIIYIVMHFSYGSHGQEEKILSRDQLSTINSLIVNSNDSDSLNIETRKLIKHNFAKWFVLADSGDNILTLVDSTKQLTQLQIILPDYPVVVKSFFWLNDPWVLLEIIFWSLFGLMVNLLYSVTRAPVFDPKRVPEHIGKFFYTPFLVLIIYLSLNALINGGSITLEGVGKSVIVLSFILGFYTRRSIVLLGRIKDLLLPAKETDSDMQNDATQEDEKSNAFNNLPHEKQKRVINEYIKAEATNLKRQFPEIQGISARRKKINGLEQDYYCIHIDIVEKIKNMQESKKLPSVVEYIDSQNTTHIIQTDITGVGENKLSLSKKARFIGENQFPKQLGLSCSRKDSDTMGTIGLKVYKNGESYLLSCFHVLCAPELNNKKSIVDYTDNSSNSPSIISPGRDDGSNNQAIANVTEGKLNNFVDAAIAKLKNDDILENKYFNDNGRVRGTISLTSEHVRKNYRVKLFGRTSGRFTGELIDNSQGIVYFDDYPENTLNENKIYNMIVTEKISDKGDSGATVVDKDNKVIGMLVGDSDMRSYIIPISTIINRFNLDEF